MARIRTIKPEFPQSESMGRVSRDARLLFVQLWTICDDHGRARAHSRMLASLLFPYDDDAGDLMPGWLRELEDEGCIRIYEANGSQYLHVTGWVTHQRIDKPSKPQFPSPDDSNPDALARIRELSSEEGKGREGKGREGKGEEREKNRSLDDPPDKPADTEAAIVVSAYNRLLPRCQSVAVLNPKRRKRISEVCKLARRICRDQGWAYDPEPFWDAYWAECAADPWMRGEVPNPKNPNWRQNLDVLLAEDRFAGVMDRAIGAMREAA